MLRWTLRILLVFAVLILVAAVVIHLVLQSDWLGETILARAGEKTGMELTAESVSVGWGGGTVLHAVTVRMPLSGEVVLAADRIRLEHETVPLLILGRPVNVRSVQVDSPRLYLRRRESGRWNLQDAWTQFRARLDSRGRRNRRPSLPQVAIEDALVQITEPNGTSQTVGPLDFHARPAGMAWPFDLEAPGLMGVEGRVLPGGDWAHEVGFVVDGMEPVVRQILEGDLSPIRVVGRWEGRVVQNALSGAIHLERVALGPVAARGDLLVQAKRDEVTVRPRDLVFSEPNLAGREVRLTDGSIRIADGRISVEQLEASASQLAAHVSGTWDVDARTGAFSGSWAVASDGQSSPYLGTYQASVQSPQTGRKAARVSVTAEADASFGEATIAAVAEGAGADWRQSHWRISLPTFVWSRNDRQADLSGTTAEVRLEWPGVRLASLHLPDTKAIAAEAQLDMDTRRWSARLRVDDFRRLEPWGVEPLDLWLDATGDDRKAQVSELRVTQGAGVVTAKGELSFRERGFHDVRLVADWPSGSAQPEGQQPIGRWHLEGDVFGRLEPAAIEISGQLTGQDIAVGRQRLSRIEIPMRADVNDRWVRMATDPFDLLAGKWQLSGRHDLATELTQVNLVVDSLSLEAAAGIAGLPLTSRGQAHAEVGVAVSAFDFEKAIATGTWSAEDVNIPPLEAERARGKLRISNGLVRFDEIVLEQERGEARASMEFQLDDPQAVFVELRAEQWFMRFKDHPVSLSADGQARLRLNVVRRTATGEATVSGRVLWEDRDLARVRMSALVQGQTLDIREFHAEMLGGSLEGRAMVPLDHWQGSEAKLDWQGIEPRQLQAWAPPFERFEGVVSGRLTVEQQDQAARAPEPMRFVLDADIENGRFGPAAVGVGRIAGFVGDTRLLIDQAGLQVLDGRLEARGRVSRHGGRYYGNLSADFNNLNLKQLTHIIDPNAGEYIGSLSGNATLLASSGWDSLWGEARLSLTESDLVGHPVVRVLYNSLSLQFGQQQPTGTGDVMVRLEGPSVLIPSFSYFNRGVEIRGAGRIENISRGAESPVDGFAVASTRVLKGVSLPGVKSLDRLLATFQTGAASAKIGGTLGNVEVNLVPLPIVLGSFRNLLWAQLRE